MSQEDGRSGDEAVKVVARREKGWKKGPWTAAEDSILIDYVRRHREGNWNSVQRNSGLMRCGKSCRLRWTNHLRPNLKKGSITAEEEALIIDLHAKFGNKWARMAAQLPGRTDNEIKNYWNTRVKRRLRAGLPIYPQEMQHQLLNHQNQSVNQTLINSSPPPPQQQSMISHDQNRNCSTFFDALHIPLPYPNSSCLPDSIFNNCFEVLHEFDHITPNFNLKHSNQFDYAGITTNHALINLDSNENMVFGTQTELHSIQNSDLLYENAGVGFAATPETTLSSHINMIVPKCENVLEAGLLDPDKYIDSNPVIDKICAGKSRTENFGFTTNSTSAGYSSTEKNRWNDRDELNIMDDDLLRLFDFQQTLPVHVWYNKGDNISTMVNDNSDIEMNINRSSPPHFPKDPPTPVQWGETNAPCFWNAMPNMY